MSERIRTLLAVAVLTLAVWVWADLEQTDKGEDVIPVVVSVPPDYLVRSVSPQRLAVTYKGPRGELQDLRAAPEDMVCRFNLTESDLKTSRLTLQSRDGFRHWRDRRINVADILDAGEGGADGNTVTVVVDRLVRVKVRVETKVTGAIAGVVTAQPPEVTARVAESQLQGLPDGRRYALATLAVTSIPANPQVERDVPLDPRLGGPDGIAAEFDPPSVKVTAMLQSALAVKKLGPLPLHVTAPPRLLKRYRIRFQTEEEPWVELELEGPALDLERLGGPPSDIRVELVLTEADKPVPGGAWNEGRLVVVNLPPGIKLAKPLPAVNFNLERIDGTPTAP